MTDPTSAPRSGTPGLAQRDAARRIANQKREARKQIRDDIINGHTQVAELLETIPPAIHGMTVIDVMMLTRRHNRNPTTLARIGREAVRDQVNLLQPVERASDQTRGWAARHTPTVRRNPERQAA